MELSKYIILNTEQEAIDLSVSLENIVSPGNTTGKMFSIRPNIDKSKWAIIVDPNYNINPRHLKSVNRFNVKHKTSLKIGQKGKVKDLLKFKFEDPNKLDAVQWGLVDDLPKKK